jgi:membrane protein
VVLDRLKARFRSLRRRWGWLDVAASVQGRFGEVNGGHLAGAVTLAAFLALFPIALVAVAVLGFFAGDRPDLSGEIVEALALPRGSAAAETIADTIDVAEESRRTASVIGVAGLLWSGLGLVGALQHAYNSVWQVRGRGIRDKAFGLLWLAGSGVLFGLSFALTAMLTWLPGFLAPLNVLVGAAVGTGLFLWASKVLPNRDVGLRPLLPGAILGAAGLEALKVIGGIYVPRAVASSSALYGSLGVVFAIIAWLFFFGRLIVYSATLSVVLWEREHGTQTVEIEVPRMPDRTPVEAHRSGQVDEDAAPPAPPRAPPAPPAGR